MRERPLLRLLLDEHLSPTIAEHLRRRNPQIAILSLQEWEQGAYLRAEDALLLTVARQQRLTLVTYDQRTIVPLLKSWVSRTSSTAASSSWTRERLPRATSAVWWWPSRASGGARGSWTGPIASSI